MQIIFNLILFGDFLEVFRLNNLFHLSFNANHVESLIVHPKNWIFPLLHIQGKGDQEGITLFSHLLSKSKAVTKVTQFTTLLFLALICSFGH